MVYRLTILLFMIGCAFGHDGSHSFLTPYISPGIQIGITEDSKLSLSFQVTIGSGIKIGKHSEDTFPLFLVRTYGIRAYYQKNSLSEMYKYYDYQTSLMSVVGAGKGKLIDKDGNVSKRTKYWLGAFGLMIYEKIYFHNQVQKQFGISGVLPVPLLLIIDSGNN